MVEKLKILVLFVMLFCGNKIFAQGHYSQSDSLVELTAEQADSLFFRFAHHYTNNFNFRIKTDSLSLTSHESDIIDTSYVYRDDIVVVAEVSLADSSEVWLKLYRDQLTMGWITEDELLENAVPDDMISEIIDFFSAHVLWLILLLVFLLVLGTVFFKINRFYSVLFVGLLGAIAVTFFVVVNEAPEYWAEFYFHPTLNPFILPGIMELLLILFWLFVITFVALIFVFSDYLQLRQNRMEVSTKT